MLGFFILLLPTYHPKPALKDKKKAHKSAQLKQLTFLAKWVSQLAINRFASVGVVKAEISSLLSSLSRMSVLRIAKV